ncbi:MAG: YqzL-like protein [Firmicutes bacterium]|nr:YqzL-like protein [Bacillota bacterium]
MLIQDLMWDVFSNTGDVAAYLLYRKYQKHRSGNEPVVRGGE